MPRNRAIMTMLEMVSVELSAAAVSMGSTFGLCSRFAIGSLTATSYSDEAADWKRIGSPAITSRINNTKAVARRRQR